MNKPARLERVEECPIMGTTSIFAGCMVVASIGLILMIHLGGAFL